MAARRLWTGPYAKLLLVICAALAVGFLGTTLVIREETHQPAAVFQNAVESDYQIIFEAAIITGARVPDGASMPLDRLLALTSRAGLKRLDNGSLFELIQLRSELAKRADTTTCAAIWSGSPSGNLIPAIERLTAFQQRQWAMLFNRAARAIINRAPIRPAPSPQQYQAALDRMMSGLPRAELQTISLALNRGSTVTPVRECGAARAFYRGLAHTNPADAITITRAMLYR